MDKAIRERLERLEAVVLEDKHWSALLSTSKEKVLRAYAERHEIEVPDGEGSYASRFFAVCKEL